MDILPPSLLGRTRVTACSVMMILILSSLISLTAFAVDEDGDQTSDMGTFDLGPEHKRGEIHLDDTQSEFLLTGSGRFGSSLHKADFNGDGILDIFVAAPMDSGGSVYIFNGSEQVTYPELSLDASQARWHIDGDRRFGADMDSGDVNGDGYDDILIGDSREDTAYLYYGGPYWDNVSSISYNDANITWSAYYYGYFGYSVALGDLDGDGYDDMIGSAPGYSSGRVYWIFGSDSLDSSYGRYDEDGYFNDYNSYYSSWGRTYMGSGGMDCGDFNGDGRDDLAIGSPYSYGYTSYVGQVMVMFPDSDIRSFTSGQAYQSRNYADWHYYQASNYYTALGANPELFDYNGDGYADLVFGNAYTSYTYYNYDKQIYLIEGESDVSTRTFNVDQQNSYDHKFSSSEVDEMGQHAWGDYDGDGTWDLAVGGSSPGAAYVILNDDFNGSSEKDIELTTESSVVFFGPSNSKKFAWHGEHYYYRDYHTHATMMFMDRGGSGDSLFVSDRDYNGGTVWGLTSSDMVSVSDVMLTNPSPPDDDKIYAGLQYYTLKTGVKNEWDLEGTESVEWDLMVHDDKATVKYHKNGSGPAYIEEIYDPNDILEIDPDSLNVNVDQMQEKLWIDFDFMFTMNLFLEGELEVAARANVVHISSEKVFEGLAHVKDRVFLKGNLEAYTDPEWTISREDEEVFVEHNGWVSENSVIEFTGVTVIYNGTEDWEEPLYPPDDVFAASVVNTLGYSGTDEQSSGEQFSIMVQVDDRPMEVVFDVHIDGIPEKKVMNPLDEYVINVDVDIPTAPPGLNIHADSFDDPQKTVDNDNELYVTWHEPGEFNSGIEYYQVECNDVITETDVTFAKVNTTETGMVEVRVRAVDRVGHMSPWSAKTIYLDMKTLEYSGFSVVEGTWFNTLEPSVEISLTDLGGRAVIGSSIEYAVSYDGGLTWRDWTSAGIGLSANTLDITVNPSLVEGPDNMIMFRASDEAGNIEESQSYPINVDVSAVEFLGSSVNGMDDWEGTWLEDNMVDIQVDITDRFSGVDGDSVQYRYSTSGRPDLDLAEWDLIPSGSGENVTIALNDLDLENGDMNFVQFRVRDNVGNPWSYSDVMNIWINTIPEPKIMSPEEDVEYTDKEAIVFDATETMDVDGDQLEFTWTDTVTFEGDTQTMELGSEAQDLSRFQEMLPPGQHSLVLTVTDGIHEVSSKPVEFFVKETVIPVWLSSEDSDGDGMPNYWEYTYYLGWDDDSNKDNLYNPSSMDGKSRSELFRMLEPKFANDTSAVSENNDADGDGHTDFEEYLYGTDPTDALRFPVYKMSGSEAGKEESLFIPILVAISLLVIVVLIVIMVVYNGYLKKNLEAARVKDAEEEKQLMESALSSGGKERLDQLLSSAKGEGLPAAPGQQTAAALPSAEQAGEQGQAAQAQPMDAQPMQAQQMDAQPMQAAPMGQEGMQAAPVQGQEQQQ